MNFVDMLVFMDLVVRDAFDKPEIVYDRSEVSLDRMVEEILCGGKKNEG